ncbi:hypothetical protein [Brevundimonas sp.]|uniref:hypothetical protein n=1 Tax=Brevundimonas sp. TaxID=1871086 RepID=UPI002D749874|nr:hypothetical protein [Brevundimonas sp.]HYC73753.1 hypothetical protein [Brevundimonas sp.]
MVRGTTFELLAIQQGLERRGPEGLGLIKAELEGVPAWRDLATPVSLLLAIDTPSGLGRMALEIQPNFRIVIVRLE